MQRIAPNQSAVAVHLPALVQQTFAKSLTHRDPAKDEDTAAEKPTIALEVDSCVPPQPCAIEQDRLRRQKFEPATALNSEALLDPDRRAGRAIDFLRRRAGNMSC